MKRFIPLLVLFCFAPGAFAADVQPRLKRLPELFGWSGSTVPDLTAAGTVTGSTAAFTNLVSCTVAADSGGNLICSTLAGSGTVTSISQGTNMSFSANPLTSTGTISLTASPAVTNLTATGTVTGAVVSATSALQVGSDYVTDLTGSGLSIVGGALTASGGSSHNVLSATHADSSAASATRGDLIVANSTPLWARFAVGSSNTVLTANGTDPAWSATPTVTSLTANSTVTGATVVGTTKVTIPSGANPSSGGAGDIAEDTTDKQFLFGTPPNVLPATYRECHTWENLAAADDDRLFMIARNDITVVASHCRTSGFTTQPTIVWQDATGNLMTGSPTCNATESQAATAVTAGGAVTQNEAIEFDNTATTAPITGTQTTLCLDYTFDRK